MRGWTVCGMMALALVVGCEQEPAATNTTPDRSTIAGEAGTTAGEAKQEAKEAIATAKEAGQEASVVQAEAQKLLDQAMQYIKDNRLDLADQALTQLEGMKASLPESMHSAITNARSALDTAKRASGSVPGGLPAGVPGAR